MYYFSIYHRYFGDITKEKETTMIRFRLIMLLFISIMLFAACGNSNSDLESERSKLQTEITTLQTKSKTLQTEIKPLQAEVDALQKNRDELQAKVDALQKDSNGLIHKDDTIYILELEISQSHFTLNPKEHLKDSMNKITIPIQVSKEYYDSIKEGDTLSDEFRVGSFIFKGSIGNWNIKVVKKQAVTKTE